MSKGILVPAELPDRTKTIVSQGFDELELLDDLLELLKEEELDEELDSELEELDEELDSLELELDEDSEEELELVELAVSIRPRNIMSCPLIKVASVPKVEAAGVPLIWLPASKPYPPPPVVSLSIKPSDVI
jgi:hypothetical protein